jgi:hypothetical protein
LIPGWVVALATFPGVIVHESAHMLFCKLRGVAVLDVCFFRIGTPAGYVVHEPTEDFNTIFLISLGPFFVNSLLCIFFCFPALIPLRVFEHGDPLLYFLVWLGISIGMHAFPSTQDARLLHAAARQAVSRFSPLAILSYPLVLLIYIANFLSMAWLDAIYGFAIGLGLPLAILEWLS